MRYTQGILTACVGVVTFFTLPAGPGKTRWLNEADRELAVRRLEIEHLGQTSERTTGKAVLKALGNPFTWACTLAYGFINVSDSFTALRNRCTEDADFRFATKVIVQGTSLFLPTIISGLGKYTTGKSDVCLLLKPRRAPNDSRCCLTARDLLR